MPSWNIHTAHVEALLANESAADLGISDVNAFLFGNFVPDIYVGYVVPDVSHKILYKDTHMVDPTFIPSPNAALFYEKYLLQGDAGDVVLGAWTHLICDHYYNLRTNEFIAKIGVEPGDQARDRKQADFDLFGRTLNISWVPEASENVVSQCARYPMYAIDEVDVHATVRAQEGIVARNVAEHLDEVPAYDLLNPEFFASTYELVDTLLREALNMRVRGEAPLNIGRA